jgi:hypothetical protein
MRKSILALLVLASTAALAPAQGTGQPWAEKMFTGGLTHDFGTVPKGAQLSKDFVITNIYAVRMEITKIQSACGCVSASAPKRVLEPRESTTITVRMDAKRFSGPKAVGVSVTVGPEFISVAQIKVSANSRADVVFNPGEVNFGTVTRGATPSQVIDVEYAGVLPWQVTEVVAKDVPYTIAIKETYRRPPNGKIAGQVGYRMTATLKPDAPLGALKHDVFLKTNDPASPMVPVLIEANVQSPLTVSPALLSLGAVKINTALTRRVVLRGTRPFRVTGVEGTGAGIELGAALPANEAEVHTITFKCELDAPGGFKRELKISTTLQATPVVVTIEGVASR